MRKEREEKNRPLLESENGGEELKISESGAGEQDLLMNESLRSDSEDSNQECNKEQGGVCSDSECRWRCHDKGIDEGKEVRFMME